MKIYLKWRNVSKGNVGRFIVAFNDPFQFGKSKKIQIYYQVCSKHSQKNVERKI